MSRCAKCALEEMRPVYEPPETIIRVIWLDDVSPTPHVRRSTHRRSCTFICAFTLYSNLIHTFSCQLKITAQLIGAGADGRRPISIPRYRYFIRVSRSSMFSAFSAGMISVVRVELRISITSASVVCRACNACAPVGGSASAACKAPAVSPLEIRARTSLCFACAS